MKAGLLLPKSRKRIGGSKRSTQHDRSTWQQHVHDRHDRHGVGHRADVDHLPTSQHSLSVARAKVS
jgi:hypothetical protein